MRNRLELCDPFGSFPDAVELRKYSQVLSNGHFVLEMSVGRREIDSGETVLFVLVESLLEIENIASVRSDES